MLQAAFRKYRAAYAGLPRAAWTLSFILFINTSGTMVVFFLTLTLTRHLGFSVLRAGQVLSGYGFGMLLGNLLGGWASDRLGPRATQKLSLAMSGILLIALGFFSSFPVVLALMSLYGVSAAALFPANASALADICAPEIRSRGFVLSRLANNLGATIGPVVGGFLAGRHYRMIFWIDGITCLLAALAFFVLLPGPAKARMEGAPSPAPLRPSRFGWMKDGRLLAIVGLSIGLSTVFIQMFGVFPLYMKAVYGLAERMIGPLFAVNTVLIVLTQMPLTHAVERIRRGRTAAAGMAFLGLGLGMLPFGRTMAFAAVALAVATLGEMLLMPTLVTLISLRAPEGGQGQYQGLFGLAWGIGSIVGPSLGTRIYDTAGGTAVWLSAAGLSALLALGFLAFDRGDRERASLPAAPAS